MNKIKWKVLIVSLVVVYLTAFIGSLFSSSNTNSDWYNSIKPSITPPNFIFPIVWNILFFLIALSLYFSWTNANKKQKNKLAELFIINLGLNALWSFFFFGIQNPIAALVELLFLWGSIIFLISETYNINKTACYLLIPYMLWVSFAFILNFLIVF